MRIQRVRLGLACALAVALAVPGAASASHIKGGSLAAEITADGQVEGTASYYQAEGEAEPPDPPEPCVVGDYTETLTVSVTGPLDLTGNFDVELPAAFCPANGSIGVYEGPIDADLTEILSPEGALPLGEYLFSMTNNSYVGGIINAPDADGFDVRSRVNWTSQTTGTIGAPGLPTRPRLGIPIGPTFNDSIGATKPFATSILAYESLAGTPLGPDTDIVTLGANGSLTIPASTTSTMAVDDAYLYGVRSTDQTTGNYSDRAVVLIAGLDDGQAPPTPPEEPPPSTPAKPVIGKEATPLPGAKGITIPISCPQECTVIIRGIRGLKHKTKEPNWAFKQKVLNLSPGAIEDVVLEFKKQLRKTVLRGLAKGINPIKFRITVISGDQVVTQIVSIKFDD